MLNLKRFQVGYFGHFACRFHERDYLFYLLVTFGLREPFVEEFVGFHAQRWQKFGRQNGGRHHLARVAADGLMTGWNTRLWLRGAERR